MKTIKSTSRQPMQFSSLDDFIAADNPVRIADACLEKLDVTQPGIRKASGGQPERSKPNLGGAPRFDEKRRQAICEHPFGKIKRLWGYTCTLVKGLQKSKRGNEPDHAGI